MSQRELREAALELAMSDMTRAETIAALESMRELAASLPSKDTSELPGLLNHREAARAIGTSPANLANAVKRKSKLVIDGIEVAKSHRVYTREEVEEVRAAHSARVLEAYLATLDSQEAKKIKSYLDKH